MYCMNQLVVIYINYKILKLIKINNIHKFKNSLNKNNKLQYNYIK